MKYGPRFMSFGELEEYYGNLIYEEAGEYPSPAEIRTDPRFQQAEEEMFGPDEPITRKISESMHGWITQRQFAKAYLGACLMNSRGMVFNSELTVNLKNIGIYSDDEAENTIRKFFACFLKRDKTQSVSNLKARAFRDKPACYIYVFERDASGAAHVHAALTIPSADRKSAKAWADDYFKRVNGGNELPVGTINFEVRERFDTRSQWAWFVYMFKTLQPGYPWARSKGFQNRPAQRMSMKRVVVSESIGDSAQKAWGYRFKTVPDNAADDLWTSRWYDQFQREDMANTIRNIDKIQD